MGIGERDSRRAWGQQLLVRGQLHSPMGKLVMRVAHVAPIRAQRFNSKLTSFHVALELEHVESVDLRSAISKADAVLPAFARAGQHGDTSQARRAARVSFAVSTWGATHPNHTLLPSTCWRPVTRWKDLRFGFRFGFGVRTIALAGFLVGWFSRSFCGGASRRPPFCAVGVSSGTSLRGCSATCWCVVASRWRSGC